MVAVTIQRFVRFARACLSHIHTRANLPLSIGLSQWRQDGTPQGLQVLPGVRELERRGLCHREGLSRPSCRLCPQYVQITPLSLSLSLSLSLTYISFRGWYPVYMGAPNIDNFIPSPKSIIRADDYTFVAHVLSLSLSLSLSFSHSAIAFGRTHSKLPPPTRPW